MSIADIDTLITGFWHDLELCDFDLELRNWGYLVNLMCAKAIYIYLFVTTVRKPFQDMRKCFFNCINDIVNCIKQHSTLYIYKILNCIYKKVYCIYEIVCCIYEILNCIYGTLNC